MENPTTTEESLNSMTSKFIEDVKKKIGIDLTITIINNNSAILKVLPAKNYNIITLDCIKDIVLQNYPHDVTEKEFFSHVRTRKFVDARSIFCNIAREYYYTYTQIAQFLGGRDHTSIINLAKKSKDYIYYDENYRISYFKILAKIKEHVKSI